VLCRIRHVLAPALLAFAAEHDGGGDARELSRDVDGPPFGANVLDVQLEAAKLVPERHQPRVGSGLPVGSMRIRWYTSGIAATIGIAQTGQRIWEPSVACRDA